jgi:hypothetical protein
MAGMRKIRNVYKPLFGKWIEKCPERETEKGENDSIKWILGE